MLSLTYCCTEPAAHPPCVGPAPGANSPAAAALHAFLPLPSFSSGLLSILNFHSTVRHVCVFLCLMHVDFSHYAGARV